VQLQQIISLKVRINRMNPFYAIDNGLFRCRYFRLFGFFRLHPGDGRRSSGRGASGSQE
jgi:hypothetical protein